MSIRQRKKIHLLKHQYDFLTNDKKFVALIGGIGSGKSFSGGHYIVGRVLKYPKALHFIGANTYSQLETATLKAVFNVLQDMGIDYEYNMNKGYLTFGGGTALCRTMDNFEMLRGIEIASFWLDEVRDLKKAAFDMMMGRLRDKNADNLQGRVTSSPAGYNWIYEYFHPKGDKNTEEFKMIRAASMDNTYLPDGYLDTIKSMYTEEFYQQEILGEFVRGSAGMIYPWVSRALRPTLDSIMPKDINKWILVVSSDPGSTSTFGVLFSLFNIYTKKLIIFDEIYEQNHSLMTAREILNKIKLKIAPYKDKVKSIEYVYDEAAVWFRNEVSEIDVSIWMSPSNKSKYGVDGYINLVRAFMNAGLMDVTENCLNFWKEHEEYSRDENGKIPKKNDHLVNCAHYLCGYLGVDLSELNEPKQEEDTRRAFKIDEEIEFESNYGEF